MSRVQNVIAFVALVLVVGFASALLSPPGVWYASLAKPGFNPPNWIFAPVWTVLYIFIGIAGALAWRSDRRGLLTPLWFGQLVLNGTWSIVFFRMHLPVVALAVVLALLATIFGFVGVAWRSNRTAAMLFLPYAAWVAFASLLNLMIVRLN